MRFDRPISYNGWTSGLTPRAGGLPSSGTLVESIEPARINAVGYLDKRALTDGLDASDIYLGGREFRAIVSVFGSTWGDFWDKSQALLAAFSPTLAYAADTANVGFLPFNFIQPTAKTATWATATYPYGIPMRHYLRPTAPPLYTLRRDEVGGDETQGLSHRFELNLIARDPRKYLQEMIQVNITTTPATATAYRGDYPTKPIIYFLALGGGATNFTVYVNGYATVLNLTSISSITGLTFDYEKKTLVDATGASRSSLIVSIAGFPNIGPTAPVTYSMVNDTNVSAATLSYYEAWA